VKRKINKFMAVLTCVTIVLSIAVPGIAMTYMDDECCDNHHDDGHALCGITPPPPPVRGFLKDAGVVGDKKI